MKCGKELRQEEKEYCHDCQTKKHIYEQGMALYQYESIRMAVYRFKYGGRSEYAKFFGQDMARHMGADIHLWQVDAIVPVPIHKSRKSIRGYNQAELLAEALGEYLHIPVEKTLLKRCKKTRPLKDLGEWERQNNLKKAFHITQNDVKLKTIMVVDDIYTTGSTIDACAKELKEAGVQKVYSVSLTIGKGM